MRCGLALEWRAGIYHLLMLFVFSKLAPTQLLLDRYKLMQIQIIKIVQMKNEIQHSHCLML